MQAYILRIAPGGVDRVPEALECDQLIIGWSEAVGLLDMSLDWYQFREIVRSTYYPDARTLHEAGAAAGHMWRFIRSMEIGDLVVVPCGSSFYVAEVTGEAHYTEERCDEDTEYRRPVKWLNSKEPMACSVIFGPAET